MKTIKDFQNEDDLCLERDAMVMVNGGKAAGGSQRRESYCTGANGGDSEISYFTDSNQMICVEGFTEDGQHYSEVFLNIAINP